MNSDLEILQVIDRETPLFSIDVSRNEKSIGELVAANKFLVLGGGGSIGKAVVREIFKRNPKTLHVVDISENNLVELVRDLRSTFDRETGEFRTFAIDCGGREFEALMTAQKHYDYILNLAALKHVRSEKDPYTLMRLIEVNVFNTLSTLAFARTGAARKYFCVSTDKAANPVNLMGASKRVMEMFLMRESLVQPLSMARFANVAFSDGSLLYGFNQRFAKRQPIAAPNDIRRYFLTPQESGELCLMSALFGENRDIFFPKLSEKLHLISFPEIVARYLHHRGFEPYLCNSEDEARFRVDELLERRLWPCFYFNSDTTGEKDFEEFYTKDEEVDTVRFDGIGVVRNKPDFDGGKLDRFLIEMNSLRARSTWSKKDVLTVFQEILPGFLHKDTGKYLDQRM